MPESDRLSALKSESSGARKAHVGRISRSIGKRLWCALPIHMLCSSGAGIVGVAQLDGLGEALSPGAFCQFRRAAAPLHDCRKTLDSPAMPLLRHSCTIPPPTPVCPAQLLFRRDLAHGRTPLQPGVAVALPRAHRGMAPGPDLGPDVSAAQDQSRALSHDACGIEFCDRTGRDDPTRKGSPRYACRAVLDRMLRRCEEGSSRWHIRLRWPGRDSKRGSANRSHCKSIPAILVENRVCLPIRSA